LKKEWGEEKVFFGGGGGALKGPFSQTTKRGCRERSIQKHPSHKTERETKTKKDTKKGNSKRTTPAHKGKQRLVEGEKELQSPGGPP